MSLSRRPCYLNAKTLIVRNTNRVNNIEKEKFVTVCIKPLNFNKDNSYDLIQWLEINKILGADGMDIYYKNVHPNAARILTAYYKDNRREINIFKYETIENYVKRRRTQVIINNYLSVGKNFALPGGKSELEAKEEEQPVANSFNDQTVSTHEENIRKTWQKRKNELISYNDCFYRNLYASAFILPVDIDEIIVPKRSRTWKDILIKLLNEKPEMDNYVSFAVQNTYFLKRFPTRRKHESVFFFKHISRTDYSPPGESTKSFISTKNALTVFNHYALDVLRPGLRNLYFLPNSLVQMNHYRETCSIELLPECVKYNLAKYQDTVITRYKEEFYRNYNKTIQKLTKIVDDYTNKKTNGVI